MEKCLAAQRPKLTRLRASKDAFDANATPQAQPISNKRSLAIRVEFYCWVVPRQRRPMC